MKPFTTEYKASEDVRRIQKEPMLGATFQTDITNDSQTIYYLTLYVGSASTPISVIPDTGSRRLVIEAETCASCWGVSYDYSDDTTFS